MDQRQSEPAAPDWVAIRADYESGEGTLDSICAEHGVTRSALSWRVKRYLWAQRYRTTTVDRPLIIKRLFWLMETQIIQLENEMKTTGEKEVAVLGKLASTLEKLIEIDNVASPEKLHRTKNRQMRDIRNKLAERIEQLKRA